MYAPERIVLRSCEAKVINMQTNTHNKCNDLVTAVFNKREHKHQKQYVNEGFKHERLQQNEATQKKTLMETLP